VAKNDLIEIVAEPERMRTLRLPKRLRLAKGLRLTFLPEDAEEERRTARNFQRRILDTEMNSEQQQLAVTVRNSGESLLNLINDILDFSKIEAGKLELEALDFDIRAMIEEFLDAMAPVSYTHLRAHET